VGSRSVLKATRHNRYWYVFPTRKQQLFAPATRPHACQLAIDPAQIRPTIFAYPEFVAFTQVIDALLAEWRTQIVPQLSSLKPRPALKPGQTIAQRNTEHPKTPNDAPSS
jgi:hypothetical protein